MTEYTKKEWVIEHDWQCLHCKHTNPGREDKCVNCGKPIDETHSEIIPTDMSYENRVKDAAVEKKLTGNPDWICFYCKHRERAEETKCTECGSEKVKATVNSGEVTFDSDAIVKAQEILGSKYQSEHNSSPATETKKVSEPKVNVSQYQSTSFYGDDDEIPVISDDGSNVWKFLIGAVCFFVVCFLLKSCYDYFRWIPTTAKVTGLAWNATVNIKERVVLQGRSWRHDEPRHSFNEVCHREISGYHNCNPYSCNPHQQSYSCNCREVCRPVESCRTVCSSSGRRSSTCREVCSASRSCNTSCSTCYRTVTDTCYHRCPDYDDMCEYSYPSWRNIQTLRTSGSDHNITYPETSVSLNVCGSDPEQLHIANSAINSCKETNVDYRIYFQVEQVGPRDINVNSLSEFRRFNVDTVFPAEYNHAGGFHLTNN